MTTESLDIVYDIPDAKPLEDRHILSVLVDNEFGVLNRVVGLFSARGYNIESLTVAEVDARKNMSRITVVTRGTPAVIQQIDATTVIEPGAIARVAASVRAPSPSKTASAASQASRMPGAIARWPPRSASQPIRTPCPLPARPASARVALRTSQSAGSRASRPAAIAATIGGLMFL